MGDSSRNSTNGMNRENLHSKPRPGSYDHKHPDGIELEPMVSPEAEKPKADEGTNNAIPMDGLQVDTMLYNDADWEEDNDETRNDDGKAMGLASIIIIIQNGASRLIKLVSKKFKGHLLAVVCILAYIGYFIAAMCYEFGSEASIRLLVCTILFTIIRFRLYIKKALRRVKQSVCRSRKLTSYDELKIRKIRTCIRWLLYAVLACVVVWVLVDQGIKKPRNLSSLPGLIMFMLICLLFSSSPRKINWHTVLWSMGMQFLCALFALKWKFGRDSILWIQDRLDEFFANSKAGSKLIFGESYADHYMLFGAVPLVFISNSVLTVLYYVGAMQLLIKWLGSIFSFVLDTKPVESMAVAAGIFMDGVIAVLCFRPYLGSLSKSQLFVVITSVFSSLGGAYLAMLSSFGISLEYLVPGMLVSAPATFAVCKLLVPETRKLEDNTTEKWEVGEEEKKKYSNILDAAQTGAMAMLYLAGNVIVISFVFFSLLSWFNETLTWFGDRVGIEKLTIELIFSYLLYPAALAMGIELDDCRRVATLLGHRVCAGNMIAFLKLTEMKVNKMKHMQYLVTTNFTGAVSERSMDITLELWNTTLTNGFISDRSEAIITYCLCGFSSFISVSVIIGIFVTLVPRRRKWLSSMAGLALVAGNVANCMTGCFASIFY